LIFIARGDNEDGGDANFLNPQPHENSAKFFDFEDIAVEHGRPLSVSLPSL
jgi:hypothetical protein